MSQKSDLPPITLRRSDAETLERLIDGLPESLEAVGDYLSAEITRARVVEDGELPADIVSITSQVTYFDEITQQERTVQLVHQGQQDVERGRISIMTPVGAALIGLSVGQTIEWEMPNGDERRVRILAVGPAQD